MIAQMSQFIERCRSLILRPEDRAAYLREIQENNRPIAGVFSNYIPEEIVVAAGFHPVRIIGRFDTSSYHGRSLYTPTCGFARDIFAAVESGAFAALDCVIFPNSCDSLRLLFQMWPSTSIAYGLSHPIVADDNAIEYFAGLLRDLAEKLNKHTGRIFTEVQLAAEIAHSNQTRRLLRELYALSEMHPTVLTASGRIALVTAAMTMKRNEYNAMLQQMLDDLISEEQKKTSADKRILLMGPLVDNLELLDAIEQRGGVIVDDDITNGRRYFDLDVEHEGDLYRNLARRYLHSGPSPTLNTDIHADKQAFRRRMSDLKPHGIIYINQKFCEPHVHNYLSKLDILREMKINTLMLEVEHDSTAVSERDLLRIESFIEMTGEG